MEWIGDDASCRVTAGARVEKIGEFLREEATLRLMAHLISEGCQRGAEQDVSVSALSDRQPDDIQAI